MLREKKTDVPVRQEKRRFRLEKLEERIAPAKGGNGTKKCGGDSSVATIAGCFSVY